MEGALKSTQKVEYCIRLLAYFLGPRWWWLSGSYLYGGISVYILTWLCPSLDSGLLVSTTQDRNAPIGSEPVKYPSDRRGDIHHPVLGDLPTRFSVDNITLL